MYDCVTEITVKQNDCVTGIKKSLKKNVFTNLLNSLGVVQNLKNSIQERSDKNILSQRVETLLLISSELGSSISLQPHSFPIECTYRIEPNDFSFCLEHVASKNNQINLRRQERECVRRLLIDSAMIGKGRTSQKFMIQSISNTRWGQVSRPKNLTSTLFQVFKPANTLHKKIFTFFIY